jgi:putative Mg2+ transporter-C (MgtC) family protein
MMIQWEDLVKLLFALGIGGLIGIERELRDKAAGFRTMMFICAGSALFTIFSYRLVEYAGFGDPVRIAAQIVSGVGFLGAGAILREHGEVRGLTTAATVWLAAALGMGIGSGLYMFSAIAAMVILLSLLVFPSVEGLVVRMAQVRTYVVTYPADLSKYRTLIETIRSHNLHVVTSHYRRRNHLMICTWLVSGRAAHHQALVETLFNDAEVIEFNY